MAEEREFKAKKRGKISEREARKGKGGEDMSPTWAKAMMSIFPPGDGC